MEEYFNKTGYLFSGNAVFVEELYRQYLANPNSVDQTWQEFFADIKDNNVVLNKSTAKVISTNVTNKELLNNNLSSETLNNLKAKEMISAYRRNAHYLANLDPLGLEIRKTKNDLKLNIEAFGLDSSQLGENINIMDEFIGTWNCKLSELVTKLDKVYTSSIGVEFDQIENVEEKNWLYTKLETDITFTSEEKKSILNDLVEVECFEQFLHIKFPGAKRFSIEGGDASIVAMNKAIDLSMHQGVEEIVIGMAHRGRLNTLTKVVGKPYKEVIASFINGNIFPDGLNVSGDVKYHLGYSADRVRANQKIHLSLADNPSHLEAINSIVAGKVRAKQDIFVDTKRSKIKAILVHGDAAFCGQGVVAESLSMSPLTAYNVGGILHFVINNQLGFTANAADTRASRYSTEFAKIISAPILHVNGDDIEAVLKATDIAVEYRQKFSKDVVVEIICYRKYGHNEGDEPMYTQSKMYNIIKSKPTPGSIYANELVKNGIIDNNYYAKLKEKFKIRLDQEYEQAKSYKQETHFFEGYWKGISRIRGKDAITGVNKKILQDLGTKLCEIPKDFAINPKLIRLFEVRKTTLTTDQPIDWATAEQLAFAHLLCSGINIRLTGQDSARGTFSHRHSILHNQIDDTTYIPLNNLSKTQAKYEVANSNLSEYAALGFEYGYSLANPKNLVLWEAQFGDFANGAQIIFDQFISSSATKWLRMSGLVVLLPHAFEGQGPEHSSARLERFLQLAAEENMYITYPTTPASIFHLLRRQILESTRKPLIVMSPKSLLRHKYAVSKLDELGENTTFIPILDEVTKIDTNNVTKVILCSGKVYYDLFAMRTNNSNIVIIRLEQLYPFEKKLVASLLKKYNKAQAFIWCQEEPKNMGAWHYIATHLNDALKEAEINNEFKYVGREESASPAVGSLQVHNKQQEKLLMEALGDDIIKEKLY
ncbi:2-oxoglutarate dehydrogenase E1 component [Rickettsia prowazekii]|uniref:2-oxoglutarate dehydrogenase E1 component n=2 Tax=Rickettsia prowazekii TaxID=782 RepID=ODO1_RICPR|nr:2-oxoglutarate dehydrogenase E1 component [Rickettsia prowazekii]Q9ZDY3.1 RecName: Full=2-oxoglutarate dehydrogenase E1 component; AltName: Full=Alpha-ketoglutarate dehydrogenase [Rickettsia prowazekii str. Madrid E]AFE49001.1 2-oxoglutarate dehydrogenase E1 component [Rickettsia prowazekii str. Chernikova]AFE49846.1 2-oxoglutarate dehydrogenase E1 component [Rickettsia prowazekii str. Katsinyian]AFE50690.1 2-oxoglutarate dehydrogenase E1 component [Rickettsia prowazekii str. BuV67-CWPP]AFE